MISNHQHIIQKQTVDILVNGYADGLELQQQTESLISRQLIPQLEDLLNKYAPDEWIQIDELLIEIDDIPVADFDSNLSNAILAKIEQKLSNVIQQDRNAHTRYQQEPFVRLLLFYIRYGYLPWWSFIKTAADWNNELHVFLAQAGYYQQANA